MITVIALAVLAAPHLPSKVYEAIRPRWVTTHWATKDSFSGAWNEYAYALKKNPGYVENSGWAEKAKLAIAGLGKHPDAKSLYRAAACYLTAHDLDWKFDKDDGYLINPANRSVNTQLNYNLTQAWLRFDSDPGSKEFCRVGMAVCAPLFGPTLDADGMPQALLKAFPNDRLVISSLVWYTMTPDKPRTQAWMDWVLDQAKRLPTLPGARPQDYLTLAAAHFSHRWLKDNLPDSVGYRDNAIQFQKRVPHELGKRMDRSLVSVNKHIKKLGG